jgi:hypothetical protein
VEDELEVNSVAFSVLAHLSFVGFQIFLPGKIVSTQYMYVPQSMNNKKMIINGPPHCAYTSIKLG